MQTIEQLSSDSSTPALADASLDSLLSAIAGPGLPDANRDVPEWAWRASGEVEEPTDATPSEAELLTSKVMIVDDEPINVKVAKKFVAELGYQNFVTLTDSRDAVETLRRERPDVVLLDLMMPYVSGLDILAAMQADASLREIPVIVLTASVDRETRLEALERGASDFLTKPVDPAELGPRTRNALLMRSYQNRLRRHAEELENTVRSRTRELCWSRLELIRCLARAAEFRDDDTGRHVLRVGHYARIIAREAGLPDVFAEMIEVAAQLHDVGKIGIPDSVLLKPGKLDDVEMDEMRRHTNIGGQVLNTLPESSDDGLQCHAEIGARILQTSQSPLTKMAATIALTHHEKWDGSGYPLGLAGAQIPIEGRITAIADVFDALRSRRTYKEPFPIERCFEIVQDGRGKHFDPHLLDHFMNCRDEIEEFSRRHADA